MPIFYAKNKHCKSCGKPPMILTGNELQTSYFENDYGEQLIYTYDVRTGKALLYHGDAGWGPISVDIKIPHCSLSLSQIELEWLCSCVLVSRVRAKNWEKRKAKGVKY